MVRSPQWPGILEDHSESLVTWRLAWFWLAVGEFRAYQHVFLNSIVIDQKKLGAKNHHDMICLVNVQLYTVFWLWVWFKELYSLGIRWNSQISFGCFSSGGKDVNLVPQWAWISATMDKWGHVYVISIMQLPTGVYTCSSEGSGKAHMFFQCFSASL